MSWSDAGLPVIADQREYWTVAEAAVLFFLPVRDVRLTVTRARVEPAGRRPHGGRGRSPLVFPAGTMVDLLSQG